MTDNETPDEPLTELEALVLDQGRLTIGSGQAPVSRKEGETR
jgi:hypothetical protein